MAWESRLRDHTHKHSPGTGRMKMAIGCRWAACSRLQRLAGAIEDTVLSPWEPQAGWVENQQVVGKDRQKWQDRIHTQDGKVEDTRLAKEVRWMSKDAWAKRVEAGRVQTDRVKKERDRRRAR